MSNGSYGTFYSPGKYHLSMRAGGQTVTDTTTYSMTKGTQTFYCTGVADPSSTVSTTVGYIDSSASRKVVNFTAPEEVIINKTYIKVNDIWKLADNVYTKVNNVWTKGIAQSKDSGIWKM